MVSFFFYGLLSMQVFTSLLIVIVTNPMHSVLFMILLFLESALALSCLGLEFFSFLFVLIYVGAVAVLFLFIIMLLEIKFEINNNIYFFFCGFLILNIMLSVSNKLFYFYSDDCFFIVDNFDTKFNGFFLDNLSDIVIIGQMLFNYFYFCLIIAGFILLIALVGVISLSYNFKLLTHRSMIFKQLSRNANGLFYFQ